MGGGVGAGGLGFIGQISTWTFFIAKNVVSLLWKMTLPQWGQMYSPGNVTCVEGIYLIIFPAVSSTSSRDWLMRVGTAGLPVPI